MECAILHSQEKQGVVTAEGQVLPPRWVIKDMMWQKAFVLKLSLCLGILVHLLKRLRLDLDAAFPAASNFA
eukprot:scaffold13578_cov18-Tisochrysis_lutea.AAC.2